MALLKDQLIQLLKEDKVIPVIGAGVSQAAAGLPGWKGLIENGLAYAKECNLNKEKIKSIELVLQQNELTQAAYLLKEVLNAPNHPYSDWLENVFGNIKCSSQILLNAIEALGSKIVLTTNYDRLLSSFSPIMPKKVYDWSQHEEILRSLNKDEEFILHLHGVYEKPKTVIFGSDDYKNLETQIGYKEILKRLWTTKHFLFIGCSKDGVMDDDFITIINFMKELFPSLPHQHYILMNENEIENGAHENLLKTCNVQAISYGNEREMLPTFLGKLNSENTNATKKLIEIEKYISQRLPELLGKDKNNEEVNEMLRNVLPGNGLWVDSEQITVLDEALVLYNKNISSELERFTNYIAIIKGLLHVTELESKLNLWSWNSSVAISEQKNFIETAILAYNSLNRFPKEILFEVNRKIPSLIHPYYFSNYLGSFITEYFSIKEHNIDVAKFYGDDKYFFENLKRIIESLRNLLELDPNEVYEELAAPTPCYKLPKQFLVLGNNSEITIRDINDLNQPIAKIPLEKNLPLNGMEIIELSGIKYILCHNNKYCFLWNPLDPKHAKHIYTSKIKEVILNTYLNLQSPDEIHIITNLSHAIYQNEAIKPTLPVSKFGTFIQIDNTYFAEDIEDSLYKGPCLYSSIDTINWNALYTKTQLWEFAYEFLEIKDLYNKCKQEYGADLKLFQRFNAIWLDSISLNGRNTLLFYFSFNICNMGGTVMFFFDPNTNKIVKKLYMPSCYSVEISQLKDRVLLVSAAYHKDHKNDDLVFNLEITDEELQTFNLDKDLKKTVKFERDISSVTVINENKAVINELNRKLFLIDTNKMTINMQLDTHENEYICSLAIQK